MSRADRFVMDRPGGAYGLAWPTQALGARAQQRTNCQGEPPTNRTGLRQTETEIAKWRAETGG
jgi:hypothetical protein